MSEIYHYCVSYHWIIDRFLPDGETRISGFKYCKVSLKNPIRSIEDINEMVEQIIETDAGNAYSVIPLSIFKLEE